MIRKTFIAVLTGIATMVVLAGCSHAPNRALTAKAAPDTTTQWLTGHGGALLTQVQADLSQVTIDAGRYDVVAVTADGAQLANDATEASANPPPVQTQPYIAAMGDLSAAGTDLQNGNYTEATDWMNSATSVINAMANQGASNG